MCCSKKNVLIFLAGAEAFHTLTHIYLYMSGMLPLQFSWVTLTSQLNVWMIVVNALITFGLLWWARCLSHCEDKRMMR